MRHPLITLIALLCCWLSVLSAADQQPSPDTNNTPFTEVLQSKYPSQEHFVAEFFNVVAIMAMVIIGMLIVAWFLKRMLATRMVQGNATSRIKIEERRILGHKSQVYLLEVDGVCLIIGETPAGLVRLGEISRPDERPVGTPFSNILDR